MSSLAHGQAISPGGNLLRLDQVAVVTNLIKSVASVDDVGSVDRPIPDVQAVDLLKLVPENSRPRLDAVFPVR